MSGLSFFPFFAVQDCLYNDNNRDIKIIRNQATGQRLKQTTQRTDMECNLR